MELITPVHIAKQQTLSYTSVVMMLGSCFAQNMGEVMRNVKMNVCVNPFGISYNPLSIASNINRVLDHREYSETEIIEYDNCWFSFDYHGMFSSSDKVDALTKINEAYRQAEVSLDNATHFIVTFGSSYVYEYEGRVVNNCHKMSNKLFVERQLTIDEIVQVWQPLLQRLYMLNPKLEVIFTVSPVRYLGRGVHASQINKATLHIAIEQLKRHYPQISYFPAYEIMLDELRDYRFYADDMIHPSALAIKIIWQRFCDTYLTNDGQQTMADVEKVVKALCHRPLHPDSEQYRKFVAATEREVNRIQTKYPHISFNSMTKEV